MAVCGVVWVTRPPASRAWGACGGRTGQLGLGSGSDGLGALPSQHTHDENLSVGKSAGWRADPAPSNPKIAVEPHQRLGLVGSGVGKELVLHRGERRGANEADGGRGENRGPSLAWAHPHRAGDIPPLAGERQRVSDQTCALTSTSCPSIPARPPAPGTAQPTRLPLPGELPPAGLGHCTQGKYRQQSGK